MIRGRHLLIALGVTIACASGAVAAVRTPDPPELPALDVTAFPPAARADVEAAWRAAARRPGDAGAAGALAMTLHAWEQFDTAHQAYVRAQALDPADGRWWYLDGVVLQRLMRTDAAAAALREALERRPGYLPALSRLAESTLDAGDTAAGARLYGQLAAAPATAPIGAFGLGRLAAARGDHEEAVRQFERAIALFPEFGGAHYGLAMSLRALGRREEAVAALERHRVHGARWPGVDDPLLASVGALKDDPRARVTKAMRLAEDGDLQGAIAEHEAALEVDPSLAQAHANLLTLYGRTGNWAKAEEHYRAVLALGFTRDEAHYNYGVLLTEQERWSEAAAAYRDAIAANPRHARAHNNLGQALEREGDIAGAAGHYRLAVDSQPTFRLARFNLARMLLASGRFDDAIRELEPAIEPRDGESPRYLFALAVAHAQAGRRERGIALATEARALALRHGQPELAAAIERDLARLVPR